MSCCPICCEEYTSHRRKQVDCSYCHKSCCLVCAKRYILQSMQDAHCLFCFNVFSDTMLRETFNKTWVHGEYKRHRENILLQREKQLLPDTQPLVRNYKDAIQCRQRIDSNTQLLLQLRQQCEELRGAIWRDQHRVDRLERNGYRDVPLYVGEQGGSAQQEQKKRVIFGCPLGDCRGFVEDGSCGTCQANICMQCGTEKDEDHECNPDTKKGFQYVLRHSKRCPRCYTNISRVDGCSQMWCVACKTAFDYNTMEICHGAVHNPHYFEHLRQQDMDLPEPMNDDDFCNREPIPTPRIFARKVRETQPLSTVSDTDKEIYISKTEQLFSFMRNLLHIYDITVRRLRRRNRMNDHSDLRLKYLLNQISEDEWKIELQRREKKVNKNQGSIEIYEMACIVGGQYLWQYIRDDIDVYTLYDRVMKLREYANTHLSELESKYSMVVERYV